MPASAPSRLLAADDGDVYKEDACDLGAERIETAWPQSSYGPSVHGGLHGGRRGKRGEGGGGAGRGREARVQERGSRGVDKGGDVAGQVRSSSSLPLSCSQEREGKR